MSALLANAMKECFETSPFWRQHVKHSAQRMRVKARVRHLQWDCGPVDLEVFWSGLDRRQYEEDLRLYEAAGHRYCRVCQRTRAKGLVYRDRLAIVPDPYPFFAHHMLLLPTHPDLIDDTFRSIGHNIKKGLIDGCRLLHREFATTGDFRVMAQLAEEAPSYMITQSVRGSGASIPEHIHAHAFPQTSSNFPLFTKRCFEPMELATNAWVMDSLSYGVALEGGPADIADRMTGWVQRFGVPCNHYFRADESFGSLVGLLVPRRRETPPRPALVRAAGWSFGAFEVLGLYDAKTEEIFEKLSFQDAYCATRSVTLSRPTTGAVASPPPPNSKEVSNA